MNKIKYITFSLIITLLTITNVYASSISLRSSNSSVTTGSTVTITATINSDGGIYSTEGNVTCQGAGIGTKSLSLNSEDTDASSRSKTFSFSVKPTSSGTISCSTSNVMLYELSKSSGYSLSNSSVNITVSEPKKIETPTKEYSSNNYLKKLSVDGYDISPSFSKDKLEYTLEVPNETEKIKISATTEDNNAELSGIGEKDVVEGSNKFEIKVTAENGNERKYTIIVTVKEKNPIKVKVNKKEYTVLRKEESYEAPKGFEKSTVKIGEEDVLAYHNELLDLYVVGLQDSDGNTSLYVYNNKTNKYSLYKQITLGDTTIYLKDHKKPNNNYKEYKEKLNDIETTVYKLNKNSKTGIIYGVNILTGNEDYYIYDKEESTIQRYLTDEISLYKEKANNYYTYLIISVGILLLILVLLLIKLIVKKSKKNKRHK